MKYLLHTLRNKYDKTETEIRRRKDKKMENKHTVPDEDEVCPVCNDPFCVGCEPLAPTAPISDDAYAEFRAAEMVRAREDIAGRQLPAANRQGRIKKMESKHTPGPWKITKLDKGLRFEIHNPDTDYWIAQVQNPKPINGQANASLIAAAPDMLEALTEMVGWFDSSPFRALMTKQGYQAECHRIINTSRAAIAKAQGK
jgi:hypothetical protein